MLRNKYVMAIIGALMVLVAVYNIAFFSKRSQSGNPSGMPAFPAGSGPAQSASRAASRTNVDYAPKWTRDPFWYTRSGHHRAPAGNAPVRRGPELVLEAIMLKDGTGSALINGIIVRPGETIDGVEVVEIGSRYIKIKNDEGIKKLFFKSSIPGEDQ
jgi:hypothetical protein